MAKTYYKERERGNPGRVNWAEAGKSAVAGLEEVAAERQAKRDEIDQLTASTKGALTDMPEGEHDGMNSFWLDHSSTAQAQMLEKENLLKRGKMSPRDYVVFNNNLTTGTQQVAGVMKTWQDAYSTKMERMNKGQSARMEQWDMENMEQYKNLDQSSLHVDPKTGLVTIEKKVKQPDGSWKTINEPANRTSISNLQKRMGGTFDKFPTDDILKDGVDKLGTYVETVMEGNIASWEDVKKNPEWGAQKKTFIDSLMTNDYNIASVLTDSTLMNPSDEPYDFTDDPIEAENDHGKIYVTRDPSSGRPVPHLESWHKDAAREYLTTRYESMIDQKEKAWLSKRSGRTTRPTQEELRQRERDKDARGYVKDMDILLSGSESESKAATENLRTGMNNYFIDNKIDASIGDVSKDEEFLYIDVNKKGSTEPVRINLLDSNGNPRAKVDIIKQMHNYLSPHRKSSFSSVIDNFNRTEGGLSNKGVSSQSFSVRKPFVDKKPLTTDALTGKGTTIGDELYEVDTPKSAVVATDVILNRAFDGMDLPIDVSTDSSGMFNQNDFVTITVGDSEPVKVAYDGKDDMTSLKSEIDKIIRAETKKYNESQKEPKRKPKPNPRTGSKGMG